MNQHSKTDASDNQRPNVLAGLEAELLAPNEPAPTPTTPPGRTAPNTGSGQKRVAPPVPFPTPAPERTEPILNNAPKRESRSGGPIDDPGNSIISKIQKAADLSNENCDRAMTLAHRLSIQLRAAEDRIHQLETELQRSEDRADRAERWLHLIEKEIEEKLIAPITASGEQPRRQ